MVVSTKRVSIIFSIILMVVGILISLLSYFSYDVFIHVICIILGIIIILLNIYPVMVYSSLMTQDKRFLPNFIISLSFLIIGILFIFSHGFVLSIITTVFLIILPIIRIILVEDKKSQIIKEIPLLIIGVMVFFNIFDGVFRYVLIASGALLFVLGLVYLIYSLTHKEKTDDNIIDAEIKEI